jgi:hypothetical protein
VWIAACVAMLFTAAPARATSDANLSSDLTPTTSAGNARGKMQLKLQTGARSRFKVSARQLTPDHTYDVVVGGVKVGSFDTNPGGHGRLRLSTQPRGNESLLGFDPRGMSLSVRDAEDGDDDLVTDVPDDQQGDGACCVASDGGGSECDDISAAECAAAGGTVASSSSCLPNPCGSTPPSGSTVCCTNQTEDDESDAECEDDVADADCAAAGGMVVQAASCDNDPCQATPPPAVFACCTAQSNEDDQGDDGDNQGDNAQQSSVSGGALQCEVRSAQACAALGGTKTSATSCDPNPCNAGSPSGAFLDGNAFF